MLVDVELRMSIDELRGLSRVAISESSSEGEERGEERGAAFTGTTKNDVIISDACQCVMNAFFVFFLVG